MYKIYYGKVYFVSYEGFMGEFHFSDISMYDLQGLESKFNSARNVGYDNMEFNNASTTDYDTTEATRDVQLNGYIIDFKESCVGADYLNSCCNVEFTIYDKNLKKLGKFKGHIDHKDQFYQYEKNKDSNLFESKKVYTLELSHFFKIS